MLARKENETTLVIAGKWNKYTLSAPWVCEHIFNSNDVEFEFSHDYDLPHRFTKDNIRFVPTDNKVTFVSLNNDFEKKETIERMAKKLLTELHHTPILAYGYNAVFEEDTPCPEALSLFVFGDADYFSDSDLSLQTSAINRSFIFDNYTLNIAYSLNEEGVLTLKFNMHKAVSSSSEAIEGIEGGFTTFEEFLSRFCATNVFFQTI